MGRASRVVQRREGSIRGCKKRGAPCSGRAESKGMGRGVKGLWGEMEAAGTGTESGLVAAPAKNVCGVVIQGSSVRFQHKQTGLLGNVRGRHGPGQLIRRPAALPLAVGIPTQRN